MLGAVKKGQSPPEEKEKRKQAKLFGKAISNIGSEHQIKVRKRS